MIDYKKIHFKYMVLTSVFRALTLFGTILLCFDYFTDTEGYGTFVFGLVSFGAFLVMTLWTLK